MDSLSRVVFFQVISWLVLSLIFWIFKGDHFGLSAFLGGGSCVIPAVLVVLLIRCSGSIVSPLAVFIYEFIKVITTIVCFVAIAMFYKNLEWGAFLVTSVAVLISHLFALAYRR